MKKKYLFLLILLLLPAPLPAVEVTDEISREEMDSIPKVTVQQLKLKVSRGDRVAIIDARTGTSWENSDVKIKGAIRIMMRDMIKNASLIPMGSQVVIYCT